jgi:hypothetical protein
MRRRLSIESKEIKIKSKSKIKIKIELIPVEAFPYSA